MTTLSGSASPCSLAARFGVSPTIACSWAAPLAEQVADDDQPGRDADPDPQGLPRRLEIAHRRHQLEPSPNRPLGIVLLRPRVAEVGQHPIAHVLGDEATEAVDRPRQRAGGRH